jgi:cobalamin-dependent methionine synthase I
MFTVIGERINTTRQAVKEATAARDAAYIRDDVRKQEAAGATYIDVNAGARIGYEMEDLTWLVNVIQDAVNLPLCLDSPDPEVLGVAFGLVKRRPLINSISLEADRFDTMMSFLDGKDCSVVGLCMDDTGLPADADDVVLRATRLSAALEHIGFTRDRVFIDPLVQPIGTDQTKGLMALESVRRIRHELPGVHFTCGLSNISFGLPQRKIINRIFLALMMGAGLDGAIIDPLDDKLMAVVRTTEMLLGDDEWCTNYLCGVRAEQIVS